MEVKVAPVSRVVGHIELDIKIEGEDVKARLKVLNDPRFIEALVVGRRFDEVPELTSRICGPCSVNHTIAPAIAMENAVGFTPTEDVKMLREVLCNGVNIQNQAVHLYFLSLQDFVGEDSFTDLVQKHPKLLKTGLKLMNCGNRLVESIAGRVVHPNAVVVGGFTKTPTKEKIESVIRELRESRESALETADLFLGFNSQELKSPSDLHLVTSGENDYPFIGDSLQASDGYVFPSRDYRKYIQEEAQSYTTSKYCLLNDSRFYVGSRARLNMHAKGLSDSAKEYAAKMKLPLTNPFENIHAKAIEVLHCVENSIETLESLKDKSLKTRSKVEAKEGEGVGTLEAPRGVLIHNYAIDKNGIVTKGNAITPTALNGKHAEASLEELVRSRIDKVKNNEELKRELENLVRAYDPCLGCATHLVQVNIERA
jgi:coenzyme F420-reducing hydrogenase alpha subunit